MIGLLLLNAESAAVYEVEESPCTITLKSSFDIIKSDFSIIFEIKEFND